MRTTATALTLAISLALGAPAIANDPQDPTTGDQDTTSQQLTQEEETPTTDPVDTVDDPLDPVMSDPLTAETDDSSTMDQTDPDDMDEPSYDATVAAELPPGSDAGTGQAGSAGGPPAAALQEFASYDANADGFVERSELKGDNAVLNDGFVRFDSNNDNRLDRYEFDQISTGSFAALDANADSFLDETEASAFASLGASFASVDIDADGRVSETEHRAFLDSDAWASDRDRYAFRYLDLDGDGFVSRTEAAQFADFQSEFDVLDEDADGLVDSSQYDLFMNDWDEDGMAYETEGE